MSNVEIFEQKMAAFTFADHQKILTYHKTLERNGLTLQDVIDFVDFKRKEFAELEAIRAKHKDDLEKMLPVCSECGGKMLLRGVNRPKGPSNIHGWKSCFECMSETCVNEKYTTKRPEDVIKLMESKYKEGTNTKLIDLENDL
jgi:hypothetical protein